MPLSIILSHQTGQTFRIDNDMKKIATITYIGKFDYYYDRGQTREARELLLGHLNPSQRSWIKKRPWKVIKGSTGIEVYASMGKFVPLEHEEAVADILFATL